MDAGRPVVVSNSANVNRRKDHGTSYTARNVGCRRSLWTPQAQMASQDGSVHFYGEERYSFNRSKPYPGQTRRGFQCDSFDCPLRSQSSLCSHQKAGQRNHRGRGSASEHALRDRALVGWYAHQFCNGSQIHQKDVQHRQDGAERNHGHFVQEGAPDDIPRKGKIAARFGRYRRIEPSTSSPLHRGYQKRAYCGQGSPKVEYPHLCDGGYQFGSHPGGFSDSCQR